LLSYCAVLFCHIIAGTLLNFYYVRSKYWHFCRRNSVSLSRNWNSV